MAKSIELWSLIIGNSNNKPHQPDTQNYVGYRVLDKPWRESDLR